MLQTYACLIRDRRYSVPTLKFIDAADDASARRRALDELAASPEHLEVELQDEGGKIVLRETRSLDTDRRPEAWG